ncbi:response regulator transcription factor [Nocardiopsis sp. Huas11]|uniref:response regulator transcription factor n=1 Tax=Nocardiopsis sp. Huas11 TaxID=2183912 RepID=UPI0035149894
MPGPPSPPCHRPAAIIARPRHPRKTRAGAAPAAKAAPVAATGTRTATTEVSRSIARGRTNQETADELFISLGTVKDHLSAIQAKLGPRNRIEVAAWAWENRLMDTP